MFIQDVVKKYAPGKEKMTVVEFERSTGIPLTTFVDPFYKDYENGIRQENDEDEDEDAMSEDEDAMSEDDRKMDNVLEELETLITFNPGGEFAAPTCINDNLRRFLG